MREKTIEFTGYPSGDHEAFCFDVDKDDFRLITGRKPNKFDRAVFSKGMYMIYPSDLLEGLTEADKKYKFEISIKIIEEGGAS
ncbi:hypothetical protein MHB54_00190 [Paenibacillus sp. FSL M7-0802]|uniref:hypothetical protein n=1 Tax=Paenibacillus sp. FSL M7-0802 TaxID=2921536 RepID=UPI0030FA42B4